MTDIDWRTSEQPNSLTQGYVQIFSIFLGGGSHPAVFRFGTPIDANLAAAGIVTGSVSLTTGFEVHPGVPICPAATSNNSSSTFRNTVSASDPSRGYLVKSK